ncbi:hypothetical protein V1478_018392, partial [Vespula squamosa]
MPALHFPRNGSGERRQSYNTGRSGSLLHICLYAILLASAHSGARYYAIPIYPVARGKARGEEDGLSRCRRNRGDEIVCSNITGAPCARPRSPEDGTLLAGNCPGDVANGSDDSNLVCLYLRHGAHVFSTSADVAVVVGSDGVGDGSDGGGGGGGDDGGGDYRAALLCQRSLGRTEDILVARIYPVSRTLICQERTNLIRASGPKACHTTTEPHVLPRRNLPLRFYSFLHM